jgi:hypothetical protein
MLFCSRSTSEQEKLKAASSVVGNLTSLKSKKEKQEMLFRLPSCSITGLSSDSVRIRREREVARLEGF